MNNKNKILELNQKIFEFISTKNISLLKDLDQKINIIKHGKFKYYKMVDDLILEDIKNFINNLDDDKLYTLIPFISINDRYDEPFMVLSQQILITRKSNPILLINYIDNKTQDAFSLFNAKFDTNYHTIFKYKSIEIDYNSYKNFR
jgi:hypothetical protein